MEEHNLKLILKSELHYKMTSQMFKEIIQESKISNKSLGKKESIELLFNEYPLNQILDLILNKYKSIGDSENYNRLFNRINGLTIDERREIERKKEKRKGFSSPSKNFEYRIYWAAYEIEDGYNNIYFEDND